MKHIISVEVAKGSTFVIDAPNHRKTESGAVMLFKPISAESVATVRDVEIGIDFHWNRRMDFRLRGELEVRPAEDDGIQLINRLPIEDYLESVVQSEMNPEAPFEFLKAHAVISRSWALGKILRTHKEGGCGKEFADSRIIDWLDTGDHEGFDVCADDHCQRYQGVGELNKNALIAVRATAGEVLTDQSGELLDARFSKCCGGRTELFSNCWQECDPDPLPSVECGYCHPFAMAADDIETLLPSFLKDYDRETHDYYEWVTEVQSRTIERNLMKYYGVETGTVRALTALRRGASGRITELLIEGEKGNISLGKELAIRRVLSESTLYSSAFTAIPTESGFKLRGRGWGHGAGLCQIGAAVMGAKGFGYQEILKHYYPNSLIRKYE